MAFNGDGPHSKRQRLEESGHRVSRAAALFYNLQMSELGCLATPPPRAGFPVVAHPVRAPRPVRLDARR